MNLMICIKFTTIMHQIPKLDALCNCDIFPVTPIRYCIYIRHNISCLRLCERNYTEL
jgi:hypothetical protein